MAQDKYVIYTLNGYEIISRGIMKENSDLWDPLGGKYYQSSDPNAPRGKQLEYHIDLSNESEKQSLLKYNSDIEQDDTALFYQLRELLNAKSKDQKDFHEVSHCLEDKIITIDFGNLFMGIVEDTYLGAPLQKLNKLKSTYFELTHPWVNDERIPLNGDPLAEILEHEIERIQDKYSIQLDNHNQRVHDFLFENKPLTNSEMIRFMFRDGIHIRFTSDGEARIFVPFDKSQSMARNSKITFIDKSLKKELNHRLLLGTKQIHEIAPSKFYAYKGLYLSSGKRIDHRDLHLNQDTVIILPNGPEVTDEEITYITNTTDSTTIEIEEGKGLTIDTMFDGEGIISMDYARLINEAIMGGGNNNETDSATSFQIRMPFMKGMVHSIDLKQFLDEAFGEKTTKIMVTDCFGKKRDLRKAKLILTQSMYKAFKDGSDWFTYNQKNVDPMQHYFKTFKEYNHALYISGTNLPYRKRNLTTLNYQFINTLDLSEENLLALMDTHKYYIENPIKYLLDCAPNNIAEDDSAPDSSNDEELPLTDTIPNWAVALLENPDFIHNSYVKNKVDGLVYSLTKKMALGRLLVKGEVRYLSRDILYFLKYILDCVVDKPNTTEFVAFNNNLTAETEALKECFYMPSANIQLTQTNHYPILRSPHLSRNEQCALKAHLPGQKSLRNKYLGHLEGVIMLAYDSFVPDVLGGADFDGDIVKIFHSDILRDAILRGVYDMGSAYEPNKEYKRKLPVIRISAFQSKATGSYDEGDNDRVDYNVIFHTFANRVGMISNLAIRLGTLQYGEKKENSTYSCEKCTILTGLEIDACKSGIHPSIYKSINASAIVEEKYISSFLPFIKKLKHIYPKYITKKEITNKKDEETKVIFEYKYKDKHNKELQVHYRPNHILELLAYYFMEYENSLKKTPPNNPEKDTSSDNTEKGKTKNRYRYFDFQTDSKWWSSLNPEKYKTVCNILDAYNKNIARAKEYRKTYLKEEYASSKEYFETFKLRLKIVKILSVQYGTTDRYSLYCSNIHHRILEYIYSILPNKFEGILSELEESGWPFLYEKQEKLNTLSTLFGLDNKSQASKFDDTIAEYLCNFNFDGYYLLYLFLKEAIHLKQADNRLAEHISEVEQTLSSDNDINKDEEHDSSNDDNNKDEKHDSSNNNDSKINYNKEMQDFLDKKHLDAKSSPSKVSSLLMKQIKKKYITECFPNINEIALFKMIYRASNSHNPGFFWEYYSSEEIKERIYKKEADK